MKPIDKDLYARAEKYFIDTFNAQPLHAREVLGIETDITVVREMDIAMHHLRSVQSAMQLRIENAQRRIITKYLSLTN